MVNNSDYEIPSCHRQHHLVMRTGHQLAQSNQKMVCLPFPANDGENAEIPNQTRSSGESGYVSTHEQSWEGLTARSSEMYRGYYHEDKSAGRMSHSSLLSVLSCKQSSSRRYWKYAGLCCCTLTIGLAKINKKTP